MIHAIVEKLRRARSVVLSTHRRCDGDGLGAELALFHALKKTGKSVSILNLDKAPRKYAFLAPEKWITIYQVDQPVVADLALIFDTNDSRLVEPLYSELRKSCAETLFIDHHPILLQGPEPTLGSLVDVSAASTGELTYEIINLLGIPLDADIARALYTSLAFDTHLFRYVKSAPRSHMMAADLLKYERNPEEIHRFLFANYTAEKMEFLAHGLSHVEYLYDKQIAFIYVSAESCLRSGIDPDESGDLIDFVMNINSLEVAALLREDAPGEYKLSLRSKGDLNILRIAEELGGGGHKTSAGAYLRGDMAQLRERILQALDPVTSRLPGLAAGAAAKNESP
jgi:phosphoesterase RecJ-like protein